MKRFLIVVCLASAIPGWKAVAVGPFPWWFHTRAKPVLLDDQPAVDARNRAPDSRRLNLVDDRRVRQEHASKSWLAEFFARGWRAGAQRSK